MFAYKTIWRNNLHLKICSNGCFQDNWTLKSYNILFYHHLRVQNLNYKGLQHIISLSSSYSSTLKVWCGFDRMHWIAGEFLSAVLYIAKNASQKVSRADVLTTQKAKKNITSVCKGKHGWPANRKHSQCDSWYMFRWIYHFPYFLVLQWQNGTKW
jgi:hypothetical protein